MHKRVSMVFDSRQESAARLAQLMMATFVEEAVRHRDVGDVAGPDVVRLRDRQPAHKIRIY